MVCKCNSGSLSSDLRNIKSRSTPRLPTGPVLRSSSGLKGVIWRTSECRGQRGGKLKAANKYVSRLQKHVTCKRHHANCFSLDQTENEKPTREHSAHTAPDKTHKIYPSIFYTCLHPLLILYSGVWWQRVPAVNGWSRVTRCTSRQFITGPQRTSSNHSHSRQMVTLAHFSLRAALQRLLEAINDVDDLNSATTKCRHKFFPDHLKVPKCNVPWTHLKICYTVRE